MNFSNLVCNICGHTDFIEFGNPVRINARCKNCQSLERHRAVYHVLLEKNLLQLSGYEKCLHMAPEKILHTILLTNYKSGYICTDISPKKYPHAQCLTLSFPDQYQIFPDNYFDLIIHNHILEHIPGDYRSYISELYRLLKTDGRMIFTIPDNYILQGIHETKHGGEFLCSDEERTQLFGQYDHVKIFGTDMIEFLRSLYKNVELLIDPRNRESDELKNKHNAIGIVYFCTK